MSGMQFKSGLSAGGPSFADKAKLQLRRPTPDSDAVASSDDEPVTAINRPAVHPSGRRPSSGWLQDIQPNRKFSLPSVSFAGSQPTTPSLELPQQARASVSAFPWNTNSFTAQTGTRLKEVLSSPTTLQPAIEKPLPSPTHIESEDAIGFLLTQNTSVRKQVRSQSYSVGQADLLRSSLRHRPSKPSLLGDGLAQLSQLREDDIDEIESSNGSQHGVALPADYWEREREAREAKQSLLKQAAVQNARSPYRPAGSPSGRRKSALPRSNNETTISRANADFAVDEADDHYNDNSAMDNPMMSLTRRFSEHMTSSVAGDQLGRRHSFATYTSPSLHLSTLPGHDEVDEELVSPLAQPEDPTLNAALYFNGHGPAGRMANASAISAAHPDPLIPYSGLTGMPNPVASTVPGRAGRRIHVVVFKCNRADIFYTWDNTGLEIRRGDLVIVEGDRGCDLGQVSHADVTMEEAKKYKAEASDEHYRWLAMFSQYSISGAPKDNPMLGALARSNGFPHMSRSALTSPGTPDQDTKPKMIKRLAQQHEISALREKEGSEAKAKRTGVARALEHKLPMEILDAEFQADYHKLTFFYYAESYVNFNELVTDIFKHYKIRIWMSAVNPDSVVNPAAGPSAIGPGAIIPPRSTNTRPVGPGFSSSSTTTSTSSSYRGGHQNSNRGASTANTAGRGGYSGTGHFAFASQLQGYDYRYAAYQNASYQNPSYQYSRGSPLNSYAAYYPPTTYSSPPAANTASSGTAGAGQGVQGAPAGQPPAQAATGEYAALYAGLQNLNFGGWN